MLGDDTRLGQARPVNRGIRKMDIDDIAENLAFVTPDNRMTVHIHDRIPFSHAQRIADSLDIAAEDPDVVEHIGHFRGVAQVEIGCD